MPISTYDIIMEAKGRGRKLLAVLIDPDKYSKQLLQDLRDADSLPDLLLVGGSLVMSDTDAVIGDIRETVGADTPIVLFPGDGSQLSSRADAVMLLSLVSGRNPEYLIGQHVRSAFRIRSLGLETIPTAYMLIDGGNVTSVQYVSNTMPLPSDKRDLAAATALAAEQLGMRMVYLEGGSGAKRPIPTETIRAVRKVVEIPIIVGGGLRDADAVRAAFDAGADIAVVGTAIERDPSLAKSIVNWQDANSN